MPLKTLYTYFFFFSLAMFKKLLTPHRLQNQVQTPQPGIKGPSFLSPIYLPNVGFLCFSLDINQTVPVSLLCSSNSYLSGTAFLVPAPSTCPNSIHITKPKLKCHLYYEVE